MWTKLYCEQNLCRGDDGAFTLNYYQDTNEAASIIRVIFKLKSFPHKDGRTDTFEKQKEAFELWMKKENELENKRPQFIVPSYEELYRH